MENIGIIGENLATCYLVNKGYQILERNFKVRFGEIDIITQKGKLISFVEVKCRKSSKYGLPEESVTFKKRKKIIRVAQYYIVKHNLNDHFFSFDVISILLAQKQLLKMYHIKNAFNQ